MPKGTTSQQTASTITQKWEADARKDPEEEYFRLVSRKSKIVLALTYSCRFCTELLGSQNYIQRARHRLRVHGFPRQALRQVQEAEGAVPSLVLVDRAGTHQGKRDVKEGRRGPSAP